MSKEYSAEEILEALARYGESIFITDGEGNIIFINELGAQRLGDTRENLLHRNVKDLLDEGLYERSTALEAIQSGQEVIGSIFAKADRYSASHSIPVLDENGRVTMVVTNNMNAEHTKEWEKILGQERKTSERLRRELDYLHLQDHQTLIAESPAMKKIIDAIAVIAPTDSNVVIMGESGTGKDLTAKLIHSRSARAENSFISVNCAAIPENLLESELFGYEGGAFTGALAKGKMGLFEAAAGGTIFLDEIGEMPFHLQSKLLRALENKEILRVGGTKTIPVDVRIICATNARLEDMVKEKQFREDLYYRLTVFSLVLPPLRERREDVIPLAELFLQELNDRYGKFKTLSQDFKGSLLSYDWPGNIRELRNVTERVFIMEDEDAMGRGYSLQAGGNGNKNGNGSGSPLQAGPADLAEPLQEFESLKAYMHDAEERYIRQILEACDGSVTRAAARLGIHRSALYRKLQAK